ncbi:MAG TPA: class I SAM-dependent methyltransferase [Gaiellaceae bacterium]
MTLVRKAARLPDIARDGWRYPALRVRARGEQTAVEALAALGLRTGELEREFEELAPRVYEQLAERAREGGDELAATRAAGHSESSEEGKKLLYLSVRATNPRLVVETGPFNGASSTFLLRALEANGGEGRLLSFDLPDARDALGVPIPEGREPAWLVPDDLRDRFELVLGDTRRTLRPRLARERAADVFFHDSLHTTRHMLFEFRAAWRHLRPGGVLVSDDVFWNPAFWLFTRVHRVPFRHIGTMGVTRKP